MLDPLGLLCATPNGIASVRQLFLIRAEHVVDIPEPDPDTYTVTTVSILPGTAFLEYQFEPDQLGFFTETSAGPSGTSYRHIITAIRQGMKKAVAEELQRLMDGAYVAIIRTFENQVLIVGTPAAPLQFRSEYTSGPARNDSHTNTWRIEAVSDRPAFHMDGNIEPPDEMVIPIARLAVTESGACAYRITAGNSRNVAGALITALSSAPTLQYDFIYLGVIMARARIAPNANAAVIGNWTLISGSKSSADFKFEFVDRFTGTGFDFNWNPIDLGGVLPDQQVEIVLRIIEGAATSLPSSTGIVFTCAPGIGTMIIGRTFMVD